VSEGSDFLTQQAELPASTQGRRTPVARFRTGGAPPDEAPCMTLHAQDPTLARYRSCRVPWPRHQVIVRLQQDNPGSCHRPRTPLRSRTAVAR
jgi:hypothetical protein